MSAHPNEALAKAMYTEWQRVSYPNVGVYPWEQLRHTLPNLAAGWLAAADLAVLNLCGPTPEQMRSVYIDPYNPPL